MWYNYVHHDVARNKGPKPKIQTNTIVQYHRFYVKAKGFLIFQSSYQFSLFTKFKYCAIKKGTRYSNSILQLFL